MKHSFLIKYLIFSAIFLSMTSCATNWFGSLWFKQDTQGRVPMEMYSKEIYSINDIKISNMRDISQKKIKFGGFSFFDAINTGYNKFKIIEKDLRLTENISSLINIELKKSTVEIHQNEELFFYLDSRLVDHGLSSFRKALIKHENLMNYFPVTKDEVGVFFAIAEISYDGDCVFMNSSSVQFFVYDKKEVLYSNAVAILNGYHFEIDDFFSTREEDISLAINILLDELVNEFSIW